MHTPVLSYSRGIGEAEVEQLSSRQAWYKYQFSASQKKREEKRHGGTHSGGGSRRIRCHPWLHSKFQGQPAMARNSVSKYLYMFIYLLAHSEFLASASQILMKNEVLK